MMEVWKVVTVLEDGSLVSSTILVGEWGCTYIPGLETTARKEGSLLFAFATQEAALQFQKKRSAWVNAEVWKAETESALETSHSGNFATSGIGFELFWEAMNGQGLEELDEKYLETVPEGTVFCKALILKERVEV